MARIPKHRGFTSIHKKLQVINVGVLNERFEGGVITPSRLEEARLVRGARFGVKIVGDGEIKKPFIIKGCTVSASAKEKIIAAGGHVDVT